MIKFRDREKSALACKNWLLLITFVKKPRPYAQPNGFASVCAA